MDFASIGGIVLAFAAIFIATIMEGGDPSSIMLFPPLMLVFGATLGSSESRLQAQPYLAYGTSDQRLLGSLALSLNRGSSRLSLEGYRRIRDLSDLAIITPVFNSLSSQEFGKDYGDYVLAKVGRVFPALKQAAGV